MMDAQGTAVGLDQLVLRARDAPDTSVAGRREASDPSINALMCRLRTLARTKRIHITVSIINDEQLSVRHSRIELPITRVARAMNQPTGF